MDKISSIGDLREQQLYEILAARFGNNCVFKSPKVYPHGQEKELVDILVLALPYAIVIQSKWKQAGSAELLGEKAEVYRNRLISTMEGAARQFNELASSLKKNMVIRLPRVWCNLDGETFELPLSSIKYIIPIVIVDFEDKDYANPELRYNDIPPVVVKIPSNIESWGLVHAFLFKDFVQIIDKLFTVGDLLLWLKERSRLFGKTIKSLVGYNELSLFSFYLVRHDEWERLFQFDFIWLADNDFFEHFEEKYESQFREREQRFGCRCFFDVVESVLIDTIEAVEPESRQKYIDGYLTLWGRILCLPSMIKMPMAEKLRENLKLAAKYNMLKCSYGIFDEKLPNPNVVFCLGSVNYTDQTAESYLQYAYYRTLSYIKSAGKIDLIKEVVVVLLRSDRPGVIFTIMKPSKRAYQNCMSEEELKHSSKDFSMQDIKTSEWDNPLIVSKEFGK